MSGHSKWSKVKHQKAVTDASKGKLFTKASQAISLAVVEGGGVTDSNFNFRLRLAIDKAKAVNMPKENIQRAIELAQGSGSTSLEKVVYEGYGPAGIALIIEAATDNRQRTVSQIKNVLERGGGNLASPGAVAYLFKYRGVITVPKNSLTYDDLLNLAIEIGAEDVQEKADLFEIYTPAAELHRISEQLSKKGINPENSSLIYYPQNTFTLDESTSAKIEQLINNLEELDDVQIVYTNLA